jgi:hypothetical protein
MKTWSIVGLQPAWIGGILKPVALHRALLFQAAGLRMGNRINIFVIKGY